MPSLNSTTSAYCSPSEMLTFFDRRIIGMLVSDTGSPVTDLFQLQTNTNLQEALMLASAEVEAACARGGRYNKDDLIAIYNSNTAAKRFLAWLTASIALYRLWQRRGDPSLVVGDFTSALQYLEMLETGKRIFPFTETEQAGRRLEFVDVTFGGDTRDLVVKFSRLLGQTNL